MAELDLTLISFTLIVGTFILTALATTIEAWYRFNHIKLERRKVRAQELNAMTVAAGNGK